MRESVLIMRNVQRQSTSNEIIAGVLQEASRLTW
jgi:hypothetical protein